jgi:RHS repeat-associated protein
MTSQTESFIAAEERYSAHNYQPLDVVIKRAEGVWMYDVDGKRYLDCLSAYSAVNQGHRHPRIVRAIVRQLTDNAAQVTLARGYMPYGEELWSVGSGSSTYGYTSADWDSYIKLLYPRARYMRPQEGRFMQQDPLPDLATSPSPSASLAPSIPLLSSESISPCDTPGQPSPVAPGPPPDSRANCSPLSSGGPPITISNE